MFTPSSTYRIQLHQSFTFRDLLAIIDYLDALGVSTIYGAPILQSRPGSTHGYDATDPHQIDGEIGTLEEFKEIAQVLQSKNMSWLQDIVPNHMAFDMRNTRLVDVLERGPASPYYHYFDIDWNHPSPELKGRLQVPFLGKELDQAVGDGEIELHYGSEGFSIKYFNTLYPLSVSAYPILAETFFSDQPKALDDLIAAADKPNDLEEWHREKQNWIAKVKPNARRISEHLHSFNRDKQKLRELLDKQFYQLTFWKKSEQEINYRRFFTVNELICLSMEDPRVFQEYHEFIHQLYKDKLIQGVRIDHIDGLNDPSGYTKALRELFGEACYIIAEKILEAKEYMPQRWPLNGTSGYEFLSYVNQLITDKTGARKLVNFYRTLVPDLPPYQQLIYQNKKLILEQYMGGEWDNLTHLIFGLELHGGFSRDKVKQALAVLMLSLPVYRIYPDTLPLEGKELQIIDEAFTRAMKEAPGLQAELEHFRTFFTNTPRDSKHQQHLLQLLRRLMQFTGPLTAKGVEDTTFYVYNPLISHDEVGDAPSTLGITINEFHARMVARQKLTPFSLNATATHDTKRGEDARLRLNILSEIPDVWEKHVQDWIEINQPLHVSLQDGKIAPSINDEYFIYQSLVGGFPEEGLTDGSFLERFQAFLTKALREGKVHTNWSTPDDAYEQACLDFVAQILKPENGFLTSFVPFARIVLRYAHIYALGQTLIKITAPGIPDIYQGCELWDLSFVDPDNRRSVDYQQRRNILEEIKVREQEGPLVLFPFVKSKRNEGYEKLFVTYKALNERRRLNPVFVHGSYIPLEVKGREVVALAFARCYQSAWIVVAIPLALAKNQQTDQPYAEEADTKQYVQLPADAPRRWKNCFTGDVLNTAGSDIDVFELFKDFPVAMLVSEP